MSVIRRFVILEDRQKSLETTIDFLLNCKEYSWDKIYLFSAFVSNPGVEQVKKILEHRSLNENTEVVIAIGTKDHFNDPSDIQNLLKFIDKKSTKIKAKSVRFICPTNNFHIKAYCFLGRHLIDNKEIGFSIIGSSNLTRPGLECEGELCISIHNLNLTKGLIARLSDIYIDDRYDWDKKIENYKIQYKKRQEEKYKDKQSRQDQNEVLPPSQENSTPVNQDQQPIPNRPKGKFIKLGVLTDSVLRAKATNLTNNSKNIHCFHSSPTTIDQAKVNFPEGSLCLLFSTENNRFGIVEIGDHSSDQEKTEGCFVTYTKNVSGELSYDIREILEKKEEYEKIKIAEKEYEEYIERNQYPELEYATLNMFENEVKKYLNMLDDENYKAGLKKGKKNMQLEIDKLLEINDLESIKEKLKELKESYLM
jgi:hypothetical protein